MAEVLKCPNCGEPVTAKADGGCVCPQCGGTFTFVAGERKLAGVGEFDRVAATVAQHEKDLAELRAQLPGAAPRTTDGDGPTDGPTDDGEPDDEDDDDDDEF